MSTSGGGGIVNALTARLLIPPEFKIQYIVIDFPCFKPRSQDEPKGVTFVHTMDWEEASKRIWEHKGLIKVDLLFVSGVLQYLNQEAIDKLLKISHKTELLFIDRTPITCDDNSFYTVQNYPNVRYKHKIFSRNEILDLFGAAGLGNVVTRGDSPEESLRYLDTSSGKMINDSYYQNMLISRGVIRSFMNKMKGI